MDNKYIFDFYRIALLSLKLKKGAGRCNLAKPSLILAIIKCIEVGVLHNNRIVIDEIKPTYCEILSSFQNEATPIRYPFYFLSSDGFWHIKRRTPISEALHSPSEKFLRENVEYASLDNALWDLLQEKEIREQYKCAIIDYYMSEKEN